MTPYIYGVVDNSEHPKCRREGCGRYIPEDRYHHAIYCSAKCADQPKGRKRKRTYRPLQAHDLHLLSLVK